MMRNRYMMLVVLISVMLIACLGSAALAESTEKYVLPGAFGESYDALNEAERALCAQYADDALDQLQQQIKEERLPTYVQVLQTTVILIDEEQPAGLSDIEQKTWDEYYRGKTCIVSFIVLENYFDDENKPLMTYAARECDYVGARDGTWEPISLKAVSSRIYANPVFPGMRMINMGGYCNSIYTTPGADE